MTLGYIAAFSETLALSVIVAKGVPPLAQALVSETEEHIKVTFGILQSYRRLLLHFLMKYIGCMCLVTWSNWTPLA